MTSQGSFIDRVLHYKDRFDLTIKSHLENVLLDLQSEQSSADSRPASGSSTLTNSSSNSAAGQGSSSVKVHLRIRPINSKEQSIQTVFAAQTSSILYYPTFQILTDPGIDIHNYQFDGNHGPQTTQEEMYEHSTKSDIQNTLQLGGLLTIFAYGQTGSGKTHTISGICNRLIHELPFGDVDQVVTIQMLEVLGTLVRDLTSGEYVQVLIDSKGRPQIMGNSPISTVTSSDEASALIAQGLSARKTVGTLKNDTSSRSHFLCLIKVVNRAQKRACEIKLVDLAGSERNADTKNHDAEQIKQSSYINSSLMALKNCIRHRSSHPTSKAPSTPSKEDAHVPVRASKLTMLLKEALIPPPTKSSRLIMIATVAPTLNDVNHSLDTFRYASALKMRKRAKAAPTTESPQKQASPQTASNSTPMAWSVKKIEAWVSSQGANIADLLLDDLEKKSPDQYVDPVWRFLYNLPEEEWTRRLKGNEEKARILRQKYKILFLKKRPSTKATDVSGNAYEPETVLLMELPRPVTSGRQKSRAQLAMDRLKEKGVKEREKASTKSTFSRRI